MANQKAPCIQFVALKVYPLFSHWNPIGWDLTAVHINALLLWRINKVMPQEWRFVWKDICGSAFDISKFDFLFKTSYRACLPSKLTSHLQKIFQFD